MAYDHQSIEKKWQQFWEENKTFSVANTAITNKKKFYALDMFPYPSGAGLHVGHPEGYTATDIICRKKRMEGYEVLHPMGWDAFGLPAENFAIKTGVHPNVSTQENIKNFTKQITSLGFSYDWDREIDSTDPNYYKWTQWLFLKFYEKGLLYEEEKPMNWCPTCKVVCANEEVEQGLHERCGNPVSKKSLKQWMFKITQYAQRLLEDLEKPNVIILHGWGGQGSTGWFAELKTYLENNGIEAFAPDMPNTQMPQYEEWKVYFDQNLKQYLKRNTILVGHSLGGGFIQRYLTEENIQLGELFLVAPTVSSHGIPEIANFFDISFDYEKIKNSVDTIFIVAGGNDPYITKEEFEILAKNLSAHFSFSPEEEHFWGDRPLDYFPSKAISNFFEKVVESQLDWPEKIKLMQKNWIGKSTGLLFTAPFVIEYKKRAMYETCSELETKKRGTKTSCEGAHSEEISSGSSRSAQFTSIVLSNIPKVKSKKIKSHISKIQKSLHINGEIIIFDGFALWDHWQDKEPVEKKYRQENAATVLAALDTLYYESDTIGYFRVKDSFYRVVFEKLTTGEKRVKTYYRSSDIMNLYQKNKNLLEIQTYSTHCEAFYADTFVVIAPDHPLLPQLLDGVENRAEIEKKCAEMIAKRDARGFDEEKESDGIFTGRYIADPVGNGNLPIWVASYALADYGTGIVKCSCHDERDFAFAKKFNIPLKPVLFPEDSVEAEKVKNLEYCFSDMKNGILSEPSDFAGKKAGENRDEIIDFAQKKGFAVSQTNYRLRDWIFTRQRYWGEPIPLVFDENGKCYPLDESELPVVLPETPNYEPSESGESPLAKIDDWVNVKGYITEKGTVKIVADASTPLSNRSPSGVEVQNFRRETSTMPNWAGSSWYWLRFMDARNDEQAWSKESEAFWGPVDLYVGGAEHAVLHLLYARFWHKALYDMGLVSTKEPFKKLVNQGLILSYAYQRSTGGLVPMDEVEEKMIDSEPKYFETSTGEEVKKIVAKMSKSLKNVVNPDDIIAAFGADTLRMYEMFMGPFEQSKAWDTAAVEGMHKFLARIHRNFTEKEIVDVCPPENLVRLTHQTVKKVSDDIDGFKFNTAISQLMIWMNEFAKLDHIPKIAGGRFVRLLAPFAPHLAEELWKRFKPESETIAFESWPSYEEKYLVADTVVYAVQVNGKLRADFEMPKDAIKEDVLMQAKKLEKVQKYLSEGEIKKEIFVPGKIVGFVVG